MSIKTIEYKIDIVGITPAKEQPGGTQGDHNATVLNIGVSDELFNLIMDNNDADKVMCRFDIYDGQGGVWQGAPQILQQNLSVVLEERHTRYGGKIIVYLVVTALSEDGETQMELYSFPMSLRLKNRPDGICREDECLESVTTLAEFAKRCADTSARAAAAALKAQEDACQYIAIIEEKIKNGEFKGEKGDKGDTPSLENYYTKDIIDQNKQDIWDEMNNMQTDISVLFNSVGDIDVLLGGI